MTKTEELAMSLDDTIQLERDLIEAIRRSSRQLTVPVILILFKTFAVPLAVFIAVWIASGSLRNYLDVAYSDPTLNTMTNLSTTILTLALTLAAWRWSEKRYGGLKLVRGLGRVSQSVLHVERAIEATRQTQIPAPEDLTEIDRLAHIAWDTYVQIMREAGLSAPGGE
jgi:hypothetical protein